MTLAHDRSGSGEPLVLIHGFGSFRGSWQPVLTLLQAERDVIAIDLPGFGESAPDVDHPTPRRLAERVASFLDELGLDTPHVAGISMGGWITLELNKMGRTRSACAICPAGFWNGWERAFTKASLRNTRAQLKLIGPLLPRLFRSGALRRTMNRQYLEHADRLAPEDLLDSARALAEAPGFDATLDALHEGHFTGAREVTAPVTVAWGDRDKLLLPRQAERARRALPQARHLWMPGCGHLTVVDDPQATARAILSSTSA